MYEPTTDQRPPMMGLQPPPQQVPTEPEPPKRMDPALFKKRYNRVVWLGLGLPTLLALVYGGVVMALMWGVLLVAALAAPRIKRKVNEGWRPKGPWWWPKA